MHVYLYMDMYVYGYLHEYIQGLKKGVTSVQI